jgi:hypothetical protein
MTSALVLDETFPWVKDLAAVADGVDYLIHLPVQAEITDSRPPFGGCGR